MFHSLCQLTKTFEFFPRFGRVSEPARRGGDTTVLLCAWSCNIATGTLYHKEAGSVSETFPSAELCGMIGTLGRRNFHRFLKACPLLCAASIPQPLVAEHLDMRVGELCELQR